MGCSTYLGLGWRYQPLPPGHPTSICDIGVNSLLYFVVGQSRETHSGGTSESFVYH